MIRATLCHKPHPLVQRSKACLKELFEVLADNGVFVLLFKPTQFLEFTGTAAVAMVVVVVVVFDTTPTDMVADMRDSELMFVLLRSLLGGI